MSVSMFVRALQEKKYLVLDGGLATELENNHVKLHPTLWSAHCLITHPQLITDIHLQYLESGADIITTASYQASVEGFSAIGLNETEANELLQRSVLLAQNARTKSFSFDLLHSDRQRHNETNNNNNNNTKQRLSSCLIAASIGPYGSCEENSKQLKRAYLADGSEYSGSYIETTSVDILRSFHLRRLRILANTPGVDILALETMPALSEVLLLLDLIRSEKISLPVWVSFSATCQQSSTSDSTNSSSSISSTSQSTETSLYTTRHGELITEAVKAINSYPEVVAIGVNCVSPHIITPIIRISRTLTNKAIIVYPNSGEKWDSLKKEWVPHNSQTSPNFEELSQEWYQNGATIIGGCCRTTPNDIRKISKALLQYNFSINQNKIK